MCDPAPDGDPVEVEPLQMLVAVYQGRTLVRILAQLEHHWWDRGTALRCI